jgi:hypothetical protein
MSRSNPYKKKRRAAKITKLFYGEGQAEEMFLKHIRKLYGQNSNVAITIKKGKGGTPENIVTSAINHPGDYQGRMVVVDNDKSITEMKTARTKAKENMVKMIENTPCLESLLLSILEGNKNFENQTSVKCKKLFEGKYINKKQRDESYVYEKIFPKHLLDKQRKTLVILNQIIKEMEG